MNGLNLFEPDKADEVIGGNHLCSCCDEGFGNASEVGTPSHKERRILVAYKLFKYTIAMDRRHWECVAGGANRLAYLHASVHNRRRFATCYWLSIP